MSVVVVVIVIVVTAVRRAWCAWCCVAGSSRPRGVRRRSVGVGNVLGKLVAGHLQIVVRQRWSGFAVNIALEAVDTDDFGNRLGGPRRVADNADHDVVHWVRADDPGPCPEGGGLSRVSTLKARREEPHLDARCEGFLL